MATVRQILQGKKRPLSTIRSDVRVYDALKLMAAEEIGALLVVDGERLVGIISERDYARKVILHGKSSHDIPVRDIMTDRVLCVTQDRTIEECMALMTDKHIRHLPVIENDRLIGVVSIGDLVKEKISEQQFTIKQLESYIQSEYPT